MADNLLHQLLSDHPSKFAFVTQRAAHFRFQALLSEVKIDSDGCPYLVRHGYRVDREYFYPASAIKLCAAVAALYKLKDLQKSLGLGITCSTPLAFYPLYDGKQLVAHDPSNIVDDKITVAHEVRKLFLVSDNVAFNRLYAFTGQRYINEIMWRFGLESTRICHRLSERFSLEENRYCEPVEIDFGDMSVTLPPKKNKCMTPSNTEIEGMQVGTAHVRADGDLVLQPMDFSEKNYISLLDLQNLLVKIFCKDIKLDGEPINLFHGSQMMLMEAMSEYPSQSDNPAYVKSEFPDDYCKLFLPGLCRVRPKRALRVYNKMGRAYGFTVENSYIMDKETGQGFFLSAVIYTNANGILNDDKYEYENVADRLMADLAEMVARKLWKIPTSLKVSSPFDCIPSSLWKVVEMPELDEKTDGEKLSVHSSTEPPCSIILERRGFHPTPTNQSMNLQQLSGLLPLQHLPQSQMQMFDSSNCSQTSSLTWTPHNSLSECCKREKALGGIDVDATNEHSTVPLFDCFKKGKSLGGMDITSTNKHSTVPILPKSKSSSRIATCYRYFINE